MDPVLDRLAVTLLVLDSQLRAAARRTRDAVAAQDPEAGDVPGWVLVTVMSATLIVGLLLIAGPLLNSVFGDSVKNVSNTAPAGGSAKG